MVGEMSDCWKCTHIKTTWKGEYYAIGCTAHAECQRDCPDYKPEPGTDKPVAIESGLFVEKAL